MKTNKRTMSWIVLGGIVLAGSARADWVDNGGVVNGNYLQYPTTGWTLTGAYAHQSILIPGYTPYFLSLCPASGQTAMASQQVSGLLTNTDYRVTVDHAFWNNLDPYWPSVRGSHSKLQVTTTGGVELGVYEAGYSGAWQKWSVTFNTGARSCFFH